MDNRKYLIRVEEGDRRYSGTSKSAVDAVRQYYVLKFDNNFPATSIVLKLRKGKFTRRIFLDELVEIAKAEDSSCDFLGESYWIRRAAKIKAEEEK